MAGAGTGGIAEASLHAQRLAANQATVVQAPILGRVDSQ